MKAARPILWLLNGVIAWSWLDIKYKSLDIKYMLMVEPTRYPDNWSSGSMTALLTPTFFAFTINHIVLPPSDFRVFITLGQAFLVYYKMMSFSSRAFMLGSFFSQLK